MSQPQINARDLAALLGRPAPTDEQRDVIQAPLDPLLVVAGAGSGKTETMAARVVYLVATGQVRPEQVLGLTFTRKAAGQLRNRVGRSLRALAEVPDRDWLAKTSAAAVPELDRAQWQHATATVSTYHAFAGAILAEFGALVGVEAQSPVLSATAAWQLARRTVDNWDGDLDVELSADRVTEAVLDLAGSLADHLLDVSELDDYLAALIEQLHTAAPSPRQRKPVHSSLEGPLRQLSERRWVLPLVTAYTEAKRQAGVIDFADQMNLAARLATDHPMVGELLRARYQVVLLDEYQDTGHAQRIILRTVFGGGHSVTAVGDPVQSIYTWRGASASNLIRFPTDFAGPTSPPARRAVLTRSFRNPTQVLAIANRISAPLRTDLPELVSHDEHRAGQIRICEHITDEQENAHLARSIAHLWELRAGETGSTEPPSTAVLCRRRRPMVAIAQALAQEGLQTHIVGVGGLLFEPVVADLHAMLQLVAGFDADPAMLRILTGPRWRIGLADVQALTNRAATLAQRARRPADGEDAAADPGYQTAAGDQPAPGPSATGGADVPATALTRSRPGLGLVHALDELGPAGQYSEVGFRRLQELAGQLRRLRDRLGAPLPDVVAEVERHCCLDIQASLVGAKAEAMLDEFAEVVADYAATGGQLTDFLEYLAAAIQREEGLSADGGHTTPAGVVTIMTVHAAKGLEFDIVALPALVRGTFPARRSSSWISEAASLPPALRGDRQDIPELVLPGDAHQGELVAALQVHRDDLATWSGAEELRLAYVALTRAERVLLISAHHWSAGRSTPSGPSELFRQIQDAASGLVGAEVINDAHDIPEHNPLTATPRSSRWPVPPDQATTSRRQAAVQVEGAMTALEAAAPGEREQPPTCSARARSWQHDADLLIAARLAADRHGDNVPAESPVVLPPVLSVSALVAIDNDAQRYARQLSRPVPMPPAPHARRGTAFHQWLENRFGGQTLLDVDELPGSDDRDAIADEQLLALQRAFETSQWATRTPIAVEVGFVIAIAELTVRGRIDAVFTEADGSVTVLDWKTGRRPSAKQLRQIDVQLAAYRLAWAGRTGIDLANINAAAHFVISDHTYRPTSLPDADALARIVRARCVGSQL